MNQLRLWLLTTLILLSASRLPGQGPRLTQDQGGTPAVCNDGKITFSVARAHRAPVDLFGRGGQWEIWGWYNVDPDTCTVIGPATGYISGGWFGNGDSLTLLAFSYFDSKGVWRGIKVQGEEGWFYRMDPSNQQICVGRGEFRFSDQSDLTRECNQARAGNMLIPASFMYKGSTRSVPLFGEVDHSPDYIHVTIGPDGRAITSGHPIGSGGISQGIGGGGTPHSDGDGSPSLCGKVSCWDQFAQALKQAVAQNSAVNANNHPPAPRASANLPPSPPPAAAPPPPVDDDDPIGHGGFITPANSPAPDRAKSLQWVRGKDVVAYIAASQTGFAAYKKGDAQLSQGYRMWDSLVKPAQAKGCWVVQGPIATTLSCLLSEQTDLNGLRSYYTELNTEIAASLPRDWKTQAGPPFGGDLPNQGYRSSSGAHLEVWIARAASGTVYEIHFQLVSAH